MCGHAPPRIERTGQLRIWENYDVVTMVKRESRQSEGLDSPGWSPGKISTGALAIVAHMVRDWGWRIVPQAVQVERARFEKVRASLDVKQNGELLKLR